MPLDTATATQTTDGALTTKGRLAIVGSAPSSINLTPTDDPSWTIWGCSPGASQNLKRADLWFEVHPYTPGRGDFQGGYVEFLQSIKFPVLMDRHYPEFPTSIPYPRAEMVARYGPYWFTSTVSWMLALALSMETPPSEIAFFGIDLAADSEYAFQKPACWHFIAIARARGITISVPPESDLLRPPPLYGFGEGTPMGRKLAVRRTELEGRLREAEGQRAHLLEQVRELELKAMLFRGALDDLQYIERTWLE